MEAQTQTPQPEPSPLGGPRTPEGKAASSANSVKHGLSARVFITIKGEDPEAYVKHKLGVFDTLRPTNPHESALAEVIIDTLWRIQRCARLEADAHEAGDSKSIDIISRHESRLQRAYANNLRDYQKLVEARKAESVKEMSDAEAIRRADRLKGRTTDLHSLGFVLSIAEVDRHIKRTDAVNRSKRELRRDQTDRANANYRGYELNEDLVPPKK